MMTFEVIITDLAENDIESSFLWWLKNRSAEQAERWIDSIYPAIDSLSTMPDRCSPLDEIGIGEGNLRQLLFGIGKQPSHRVVFEIRDEMVEVLRVRHVAQRRLTIDDV